MNACRETGRFGGSNKHCVTIDPDGETRTRTGDTTIFSRVLYQLSYPAAAGNRTGVGVLGGGR